MSDAFVSTSCVKVVELDNSNMSNCLRAEPTLVMPTAALVMGDNNPCIVLMVCSSWS